MFIEAQLIQYLISKNVCNGNVFAEIPVDEPSEYVVIQRTGGGDYNNLNQAIFAIRSVSDKSLIRAITISDTVKETMREAPNFTDIYSVELNSETNYTSSVSKKYQYLATFNIIF